jgi:hypothetical protein
MQVATAFTERLCLAYDINRGFAPADGAERATREEILEYIDAHDIAHSPDHPTTAIAWDLQRTLGERDGRRLLLYASRRWDAEPLRARDVVKLWWWEDHEPQAWVDEYLVDVIGSWRQERDRMLLCRKDPNAQQRRPFFQVSRFRRRSVKPAGANCRGKT